MNKPPAFSRSDKINSLLYRELNGLLNKEPFEKSSRSDILLSLTKVETSKDLRYAQVFFTVLPEKYRGNAQRFLNSKCRDWQKTIGDKLTIKYTPKFQFIFDKGQQNAFAVEEILNKIHKKIN